MIKKLLFLALLVVELLSSAKIYDKIKDKPESRAKDFYTLLYLEQAEDKKKAKELFYGVRKLKQTHINNLARIDEDDSLKEIRRCQKLSFQKLLKESLDCSLVGFSLAKASSLSNNDRLLLALKYEKADPKKADLLHTMSYGVKFNPKNVDTSLKIFNGSGWSYRNKKLDVKLSKSFLKAAETNWRINKAVENVVLSPNLKRFGDSLLGLNPEKLSSRGAFYYGILSLKKGFEKKAIRGFKAALKKEKKPRELDKLNFWLWKLTNNGKYREAVLSSTNINIYSLYTREQNRKKFFTIYTKAPSVKKAKKLSKDEITDPFFWGELLDELRSTKKEESEPLLYKLGGDDAEPFRSFVYNHISGYKRDYYINPWKSNLKGKSLDYQALVLSLARQESHFIPSALSRSYAIGAMQMMPFLIKHIGKKKKEDIWLPEFFNKDRILPYAFGHIDWLRANLESPLLIAYAYNGGLGFTRRNVIGKLFQGHKYDPFFSMELVPAGEPREYGKKVLSNYYVYRNVLKKPVTFDYLFKQIK
ncbi:MAG: transglycosylase SLT domain-containing protein [Campylobacterales bacterium]|nr:transglycosylase SLT domain-containing protein [Campylobacterales bacterium]